MKKCLVLLMVLGIASMATAGLTFSVASVDVLVGETVTVGIESDIDDYNWTGYVGYGPGNAELTGMVAEAKAGENAAIVNDPYGYAGYYRIQAADSSAPFDSVDPGVQFTGTITGHAIGEYTIYLMSPWSAAGIQDTLLVNVVPEPMTMGLLGLGGLFLRRRK